MKNAIVSLLVFFTVFTSIGQTKNEIGKIALSVVMPDNVDGLDNSQISKLQTKVTQIVTETGLAATGYNNNFVIYPKFAIYDSNVVESGIQNITVVTADLSLFIKQVDNNLVFSTINKPLKGSGSTKALAITNAISKISISDQDFKTFIETGKQKIFSYYTTKCDDILNIADTYIKRQQYEQAIGLLMSVPEEVSACYSKIQLKAIEVYKAYQTQRCSVLIQKAKTTLASNDYVGALNILSKIDPSASCFIEAQNIAEQAKKKVDADEKKQWDIQMKLYDDAVSLEKQRIEAIKEIAIAYYKSQPTKVTYNYIIR